MTLRNARILSSCNDASNKQEQKMNVNIKLEDNIPLQQPLQQPQQPFYPQVSEAQVPYRPVPQMTNFTIPQQTIEEFASHPLPNGVGPSQSTVHKASTIRMPEHESNFVCQNRDIDLSKGCYNIPESSSTNNALQQDIMQKTMQIADLEDKNKFLQLLLRIYQNNPLYVNSLVVCQSQDFMDLVKLLTKCDKVDLILNEDLACGGCGTDSKLIYVSRILITKNNETKEMKYAYNEAYSKLISFNISTKIVC